MKKTNLQVDGYIRKHKQWEAVLNAVRKVILDTPLNEDVKWRVPCYTYDGRNIVILGAFKEYVAMTYIKGVLLKDAKKILQSPGEGTQSSRVIRFTTADEVKKVAPVLKSYIVEAIAVEKSGKKVPLIKITDRPVPEEFQARLDADPNLKSAYESLTPGRRRSYLMFFSNAKQSETRAARVEKFLPKILKGKGLDD